jgi:thioesterase domain-containing protein
MFGTRIRPLGVCPGGPVVCCLYEGNFQHLAAAGSIEASFYGLKIDSLESAAADLSVEALARRHLRDLLTVQRQGPYCLLGYSFGGLVAYEMALQLTESGATVGLLGLFDTPHPGFHATLSAQELEVALRVYRADRARKYWTNLRTGRLDRLTRDTLIYVGKKLRPLTWRMLRLVVRESPETSRRLRTDAMWHAYRPREFVGRMLLIRAQGRDPEFAGDPTMGWRKSALGGVDVLFAPGIHAAMMEAAHSGQLADLLAPSIRALAPSRHVS